MRSGDTFLMRVPAGSDKRHLWIVITDPEPATGEVVIVSVSTLREEKDQTVILNPGDHPYIRHRSVIMYRDALIVDVRQLRDAFDRGDIKSHAPCSADLLSLIQDGLLASSFTRRRIADYCQRRWSRRRVNRSSSRGS